MTTEITPDEAARYLVGQTLLAAPTLPAGAKARPGDAHAFSASEHAGGRAASPEDVCSGAGNAGSKPETSRSAEEAVRGLLAHLRCIQLDPLDRIGTNADLVAIARVDDVRRGDVHRHLYPGHAFEHFAKERCILPASAFPYYRDVAAQAPWWRLAVRHERLPPGVVDLVHAEIRERGPVTAAELSDRGRVEPLDWSGWKGTGKASTMAIEVLWTTCHVVVAGRKTSKDRLYDVPERALGPWATAPAEQPFETWALTERVEAAGLLSTTAGPHWSMLSKVRTSKLPKDLVRDGRLELVTVKGSTRTYLAPKGFRDRAFPDPDDRMRVLGPLDPLLWDRKLVQHAFGFDYVWEVYKKKEQRRWGWYVTPLLHRGRLVGRFEGHVESGEVVVDRLWTEDGAPFDDAAWKAALERHSAAM